MRCTQFIKLNKEAREFLNKHNGIKLCEYNMTEGMFDETIKGSIYECTLQREGQYSFPGNEYMEDYQDTYIEIVQAEPWSSGPCIFTCLKHIIRDEYIGKWAEEDIDNC